MAFVLYILELSLFNGIVEAQIVKCVLGLRNKGKSRQCYFLYPRYPIPQVYSLFCSWGKIDLMGKSRPGMNMRYCGMKMEGGGVGGEAPKGGGSQERWKPGAACPILFALKLVPNPSLQINK